MKQQFILPFVFIVILAGCKDADQTTDSKYASAVEMSRHLMDSLLQLGKTPGLDVAVSVNGEVIWSEGFGFADLEHQQPIIPGETRFRIGSVSKPIAAAAVGRLMDQGKLRLDEPIETYVPYWPKKDYQFTVHQLAGHLSGIRHYKGDEFLSSRHYETVKEGLEMFINDSLLFEPGERFKYSSHAFNLLSAAVEGASGEDFLSFMQREVFDMIGMNSTCADMNDSIILNRASFYELNEDTVMVNARYVDNSYKWAGGGFISTTTDLLKFGEAHMSAGYLSEETLATLTTPQKLNNGESTDYGVGWFCDKDNDPYRISHGGGSVGGITDFVVYPDDKIVIAILSNSSNTTMGDVSRRIAKLFREAGK